MSIDTLQAITTIFSKKYNKGKLGLFVLINIFILLINLIIGAFIDLIDENLAFLFTVTIIAIQIIYAFGFFTKSNHNAIKLQKNIFPPFYKQTINSFLLGIKCIIGYLGLIIIFFVPVYILVMTSQKIFTSQNPIVGIICLLPMFFILYYAFFTIPIAELTFYNTLKLTSFLNIKSAIQKIKEYKKIIFDLICKRICLSFFLSIAIGIIGISIAKILTTYFNKTPEDIEIIKITTEIIYTFIFSVIMVEVNGQAGRLLFFEENKKEIAKA